MLASKPCVEKETRKENRKRLAHAILHTDSDLNYNYFPDLIYVCGCIAQLVEHWIPNPKVVGSNPAAFTTIPR